MSLRNGAAAPAIVSGGERRSSGLLRVPLVRRCTIDFAEGGSTNAFTVNINSLGVYIAEAVMPRLAQEVVCRFTLPGNERELRLKGQVAWLNSHQQHPVHSLPVGFGVKFVLLAEADRRRIDGIVQEYVSRNS